uniref:Carbonic anhydrase n=1 Tax=Setaria digitata TaxID=48799 RepID=A0A915PTL7_9BILA
MTETPSVKSGTELGIEENIGHSSVHSSCPRQLTRTDTRYTPQMHRGVRAQVFLMIPALQSRVSVYVSHFSILSAACMCVCAVLHFTVASADTLDALLAGLSAVYVAFPYSFVSKSSGITVKKVNAVSPKYWPNADGHNQSPINLDLSLMKYITVDPLKFINYNVKFEGEIVNNGHSVQVMPHFGNSPPEIQGGGFDQTYRLVQYHFHWGMRDNEGSEHTLAGLHYPAELHLVHQGLTNPNKIAVLGVFFMLGTDDKALYPECSILNKLIEPAESQLIQGILLDDKLPKNRKSFWRYAGSLTTPPCSEIVTWTIFTEPITITKFQLALFRSLHDGTGHILEKNFRPVQKLYDRELQLAVTT